MELTAEVHPQVNVNAKTPNILGPKRKLPLSRGQLEIIRKKRAMAEATGTAPITINEGDEAKDILKRFPIIPATDSESEEETPSPDTSTFSIPETDPSESESDSDSDSDFEIVSTEQNFQEIYPQLKNIPNGIQKAFEPFMPIVGSPLYVQKGSKRDAISRTSSACSQHCDRFDYVHTHSVKFVPLDDGTLDEAVFTYSIRKRHLE